MSHVWKTSPDDQELRELHRQKREMRPTENDTSDRDIALTEATIAHLKEEEKRYDQPGYSHLDRPKYVAKLRKQRAKMEEELAEKRRVHEEWKKYWAFKREHGI